MVKLVKIFSFFIFLIVLTTKIQANNLNYKLDIENDKIKISLIFQGNSTNSTILRIPTIIELNKSQSREIKIYVDNIEQDYKILNNHIVLNHQPFANIKVYYELYDNITSNLHFNLSLKHFFLFGKYCFLIPEIHAEELNDISFEVCYFNNKIFSNAKYDNGKFYLKSIGIQQLENVFFIGGEIDKYKLSNDEEEFYFDKNSILNQQETVDYINKIQLIHNSFFNKLDKKSYYIFLSNKQNIVEGSQLNDVQIISIPDRSKLDNRVKRILAHENIHKWLDCKNFGQNLDDQGENCWFIEGFTDYYADYLNYKNGIISLKEYVDSYNETLSSYYTSPLKLITNSELGKNIYDEDIYKIAYLRGRIIAHELDYLIKNKSNQGGLDSYIKYLVQTPFSNKNTRFSLNVLKKTLLDFTGQDFSEYLDDVLVKNKLTNKASSILDDQAFLKYKKFKKIIYDFDFLSSQLQWTVLGVQNNSKTFLAGLRNGQKIISVITSRNGLSFKVSIKDKEQVIKLPAEYKYIFVPQYVLTSIPFEK